MEWLREIRGQRGKTQQECAVALGITQQAYNHYERGRRKVPPEKAKLIGEYLNFPWHWFYERTIIP